MRDTCRYHFRLGSKIVCTGITNDIDRRGAELQRKPGYGKGHIRQMGWRTACPLAREWERKQEKLGRRLYEEKQRRNLLKKPGRASGVSAFA